MRDRVARAVLGILAALAIYTTVPAQEPAPDPSVRPNILMIVAEDIGPDFGAYGRAEVPTPALDGLAAGGMLFTSAFTTAPVCSPSRSAWNTGMYQTTIGAHHHRSHRPGDPSGPLLLPEGVQIVSDWMRGAGYYTANVIALPDEVDFRGTGKTDWNFTYEGKPFDSNRWADLKTHQPFYAQLNLPETHRGAEWRTAHERVARPVDPDQVVLPPYAPDHPVVRQDWAQYLNNVTALDDKVGVILDLLRQDALVDRTIVIVMGDNGRAMVRGKQWPYDSGLHVPLIVHLPPAMAGSVDRYTAGSRSDQLISAIDVTATTLALAGVPKPARMQGRVFLGPNAEAVREYVFGGRDRGDETVDRIRTVRSGRFRYQRNYYPERPFLQTNRYKEAEYPGIWVLRRLHADGALTPVQERLMAPTRPAEELYDVIADPHEIRNLVDSPAHQAVLNELRAELDRWILESDDQGRFPEDPAVAAYYEAEMKKLYDQRIAELRREWGLGE